MRILNNLKSLLAFWKRKPRTEISNAIFSRLKSIETPEKEAAAKVIKFGKKHFVSPKDLEELYEAELEYEQKKYKARHDFPHQIEIRKSDIELAKKEKYIRIKQSMSLEAYRKYRVYRDRLRKKYPQKAQ
jgi:hypothetical protein